MLTYKQMMAVNQKGGQFVTKGHCYSKTYEKVQRF